MHWKDVKGDATEGLKWKHCKDSVGNVAGVGDNTDEREQDQKSGPCGGPGLGDRQGAADCDLAPAMKCGCPQTD